VAAEAVDQTHISPIRGIAGRASLGTFLRSANALVALLAAITATIALVILFLHPVQRDVIALAAYLLFSGACSLGIGYVGLFALGRVGTGGLNLRIAFGNLLVVVVALINVAVTAWLMFLSSHDFALLGSLLVFAAVLALFFANALARSITRAIHGVTRAAQQMAAGDLSARAPVASHDEIGDLALAFNQMASELERAAQRQRSAEQSRRDLVAAVSHDLRTPLASIRAMIEAINDGVVGDPETIQRYLRTTQSETERLAHLIDDLFELSQIDAGALQLQLEVGSLHDLISDTLRSLGVQAEKRGVELVGSVDAALPPVRFDPARIQRVLDNLVGNAIRHTPATGRVELRADVGGDEVRVIVRDTGEGISVDEQAHVFERFYRGEKSRSRDGGGAGLGLTIARGIVNAHGGRIWIESSPGSGTAFFFTIPRGDRRPEKPAIRESDPIS
jgi:signal transduction histidine kinase